MKPQYLSLYEVAKQESFAPIWALNNAFKSHIAAEGDLIICIPRVNGAAVDVLRLERTWLPIDVTAQVPRAQILQSTEFRKAVQEKLVVLVSDEYAQKLLKSEGADEEKLRLDSKREYIKSATGVQPLSEVSSSADDEEDNPDDDRNARFEDWLRVIPSRDDTQILAELKTRTITRKQAKKILQVLDSVKHIRSKNLLARSLER